MHFFSKLHAVCSLRVSQKLHASKRPWRMLPNGSSSSLVTNVRVLAMPLYNSWKWLLSCVSARQRGLALFATRTVSLFLSRRNAVRTEWKRGESDHGNGSTSRGVVLALFMAAMRTEPARVPLCYFSGLLDGSYNTEVPSQSFVLHRRTGQYSLIEHSSLLALGACPWLNRSSLFLSMLEVYD